MGKEATGAYIRALREAMKLGQQGFAESLGTSKSLLDLIEKGQTDTRGSLLLLMLHRLQGSPEQLIELMLNPAATPEDGRRLAQEWLTHGRAVYLARESLAELVSLADGLVEDPAQFQRLLGYATRLLEERKRR